MELDPSIHADSCKVGNLLWIYYGNWGLKKHDIRHFMEDAVGNGREHEQQNMGLKPYGAACDAHFVSLGPDS